MKFSVSQTAEYQTESMTKQELKEVPQILENIPGRYRIFSKKYLVQNKYQTFPISGWSNV